MSLLCKYFTVHYVYGTVHYSGTLCHYYVNTVQYITYSVNTVQYITVVHYLLRKYCTVLTSVDSNDILYSVLCTYVIFKLILNSTLCILYSTLQWYIMSLLYKYYSVNTLQYIIVVHYLVHNFCAVLMSVDSNDILYNSMHDALTPGYLWRRRHHHPSRQAHCMTPSYSLFINQVTPGYINTAPCNAQLFLMKKTKDGRRRQPGGHHPQQ